ncbi:MAG: Slp family lipoprotein [Arenicellales bacterium]|jgi:outer membrane lipoprotein
MRRLFVPLAVCMMLASCATSPLDTSRVDSRATPSQVAGRTVQHGERIQWGGSVVSIDNRGRSTWIQVLSYPVAYDGFPNTYRKSTGRFVLRYGGFLEPQDYAPGRLLTVVGTVDSMVTTSVGQSRFLVPLINAEQLKLWDRKYDGGAPRFTFGVGIGVGF